MKLSALKDLLPGKFKHLLFWACLFSLGMHAQEPLETGDYQSVGVGASQFALYLPKLKDKRVAIVTNASGLAGSRSIVDTLLSLKVRIKKIFGPEHGFRGEADAGAMVRNGKDVRTGLPVISLYGSNKKPSGAQLKDVDVVIYDIQDVGVRFYTFISTMSYVMEACAEHHKQMIVLDRPNPNGFYIDGPLLEPAFRSFLGLHHVPVVYGMTCGEYARMVNGEKWLAGGIQCSLEVIPMKNYDRRKTYQLPVRPSPNLRTHTAIMLYPSLGLFEGTIMSLGRGTDRPFMVTGHPDYPDTTFCFTPVPDKVVKEPKYAGRKCYGTDHASCFNAGEHSRKLSLRPLMDAFSLMRRTDFFDNNFNYHAGNSLLQEQIKAGLTEAQIRESWREGLDSFRAVRRRYLLYPDVP